MGQYLPIFALLILAIVFGVGSLIASKLLAPHLSSPAKSAPYECGIVDTTESPERFPVSFYLVAMIFVVFDIEVIFFVPWAVIVKELGAFGLGAILLFAALVFESFVYLISKGVLNWAPVMKQKQRAIVHPGRTSDSTIRRVGNQGRPSQTEAA